GGRPPFSDDSTRSKARSPAMSGLGGSISRFGDDGAIASGLFGGVEGGIGRAQQVAGARVLLARDRDPRRHGGRAQHLVAVANLQSLDQDADFFQSLYGGLH